MIKKVITKKIDKIWGYELWVYSPVKGLETVLEDGTITSGGPLVKIIKANQALSIQVHPDDQLAKELEKQNNGKSESWVILECEPGSELVVGLKDFSEELIRKQIAEKTFENNLKTVKVSKGQFYNIPAGLVHGIGAGITVFEVQQPSDVTYRYYDYNRLENGKLRELHIDKAIRCQKDLSYQLEPIHQNKSTIAYHNLVGTQIFCTTPTKVYEKSLVVDLKKYEAFIVENEEITFDYFAIVSL